MLKISIYDIKKVRQGKVYNTQSLRTWQYTLLSFYGIIALRHINGSAYHSPTASKDPVYPALLSHHGDQDAHYTS